jgi:hypothetical protein
MSALHFADKQANYDEKGAANVKAKLRASAQFFGVSGLVEELFSKVAAANAVDLNSLGDDSFAIVWADETGDKTRHWPLRNATEVKFASAHFKKHRDEFTFADRYTIAQKILVKAAEFGSDTSDAGGTLELAAGLGSCAAKVASDMLRSRAALVARKNPQDAAGLVKLAEVVDSNPEYARSQETRVKLAAAVDEFDRANNLCYLYGDGGLDRPEEVLFAITEKVANDFMQAHVETTTGNVYDLSDLEKLAVDDLRNWLGDEFTDAVTAGGVYLDRDKLAAIVPTLDREKGASAAVKSAAADTLLPLARLYELANG